MKTALILISLISLVSFFTISQIKITESLRSENTNCYGFQLNPGDKLVEMINYCKTNEAITFSVTATFPDRTQAFGFETQCLVPGESQVFELDVESSLGVFSLNVSGQTEC